MKVFFALCFSSMLLLGCNPSYTSPPDEVLLDKSKNTDGKSPKDFDSFIEAPKKNPFRIKEIQDLEDLIKGMQTSRLKSREAVYIGKETLPLLNGPFAKSLESGYFVQPQKRIQIFWPTDIVNNYIKVKYDGDKSLWLKFKNLDLKPQVILLEEFIIPVVSIEDSKLIVVSDKDDEPQEVVETSKEEVKDIEYDEDPKKDKEDSPSNKDDSSTEPVEDPIEVDLNPEIEEPSDKKDKEEEEQGEKEPETVQTPEKDKIDLNPENTFELPDKVAIPTPRPERPSEVKPPLLGAEGLSPKELLVALGIKQTKITQEAKYLKKGKKRVSAVFPKGEHAFSACTFNPAQGPRKSRCYRKLVLSREFTSFLKKEGMFCAQKAAKLVFGKKPLKVLLRTNGGSVNRGDSKSLHHRGRALDVFKVFLYFQKTSTPKEIVFHKNKTDGSSAAERRNYNYYWTFEKCWSGKIKKYHKIKSCNSSGSGALTYIYNSDHDDHMHISLPVCKSIRNKFDLNST